MVTRLAKVHPQTLEVIRALLAGDTYGYQIRKRTAMPSGVIIPILHRLEDHGWLISRWGDYETPEGRPPRHYYVFTDEGRAEAERLIRERS